MAKQINGAFWSNLIIIPNLETREPENGTLTTRYKISVTVNYDLKNGGAVPLGRTLREHLSEPSETMRTVQEVTAWLNTNLPEFVAADKLDLAGYQSN